MGCDVKRIIRLIKARLETEGQRFAHQKPHRRHRLSRKDQDGFESDLYMAAEGPFKIKQSTQGRGVRHPS